MADDTAEQTVTSVYQYYNGRGIVLYVGVTARGIRRAHEHAESKVWWPHCTGCAIEHYSTRDAALAREEELIRHHTPPFNTVHNDHKEASLDFYWSRQHQPGRVDAIARQDCGSRVQFDTEPPTIPTDSVSSGGYKQPTTPMAINAMLKRRRQIWYQLSHEEKLLTPCVRCGERPGARGPECVTCRSIKPERPRSTATGPQTAGASR